MYYINSKREKGIGVVDSSDGVEEFYSSDFLLDLCRKTGLNIVGVDLDHNIVEVATPSVIEGFLGKYKLCGKCPLDLEIKIELIDVWGLNAKYDMNEKRYALDFVDFDCEKHFQSISVPVGVEMLCRWINFGLEVVQLPTTVKVIGVYCFANYSTLSKINLEYVETIGANAFDACVLLKTVDLSSIESIGANAFSGCSSLRSVKFGGNLRRIGDLAFARCVDLTGIDFSGCIDLTEIGAKAFGVCANLVSIELPSMLQSIGDECFLKCGSLKEIKIPYGVSHVGRECFKRCSRLRKITLPRHLDCYYWSSWFVYCESLEEIDASYFDEKEILLNALSDIYMVTGNHIRVVVDGKILRS